MWWRVYFKSWIAWKKKWYLSPILHRYSKVSILDKDLQANRFEWFSHVMWVKIVQSGNGIQPKWACISCLYHSRYRSGTLMCHWLGSFSEMLFFLFQTLDLLAAMCEQKQYKFSRLDGSTPSMQRMQIVKRFNSLHSDHCKFSNFL